MPGYVKTYVRIVDGIADRVGLFAMYLIFLMIAVLLFDAITRNVLFLPQHWCVEFAQFTLAAYYFLGGAFTMKNDDHVRMDLVYSHLSERGRARMDMVTIGCMLFFLVVLLIGSISSLEYAIQTNERRFSIWNPSMIPIKALMVGCIVLMILQTVSLFFKHWALLRGEVLGTPVDPNENPIAHHEEPRA
jgi:TRAP-type mannitol/chloroaromatic compound transport system permease small subunit